MAVATANFRTGRKFLGPAWLTTEGESAPVGAVADVLKDAFAQRLFEGLLVRFPQQDPTGTPTPDDALAAMGRDRRIVKGINEPSAAYAARLLRWLDDWIRAGGAFALMDQLAAYMGPLPLIRTVDVFGNWYTRNTDGTTSVLLKQGNWDWDGDPNGARRWSRFWVIIYPNGLWSEGPNWGDAGAVWNDPTRTWGSTATVAEVQTVRGIVSDWKPAGTKCVNIILAFDNSTFLPTLAWDATGMPDGKYAYWYTLANGQYVPSRLSTARYWDGV